MIYTEILKRKVDWGDTFFMRDFFLTLISAKKKYATFCKVIQGKMASIHFLLLVKNFGDIFKVNIFTTTLLAINR